MSVRSVIQIPFLAFCAWWGLIIFAVPQLPRTSAAESPAVEPAHQVIACYFHRTVRCPTCKKISAYIEEAVQCGFNSQVNEGSVKMMMVDFQDAKNQNLTQAYKISGPTLVIMDVHDNKVTAWKQAPKVWSLVGKKGDFFKYVQGEIQSYLDSKKLTLR
jgi:hypothetical protein